MAYCVRQWGDWQAKDNFGHFPQVELAMAYRCEVSEAFVREFVEILSGQPGAASPIYPLQSSVQHATDSTKHQVDRWVEERDGDRRQKLATHIFNPAGGLRLPSWRNQRWSEVLIKTWNVKLLSYWKVPQLWKWSLGMPWMSGLWSTGLQVIAMLWKYGLSTE